ncbi:GTP-binding protein 1-like [Octopus sinensis]|uniref:GTP-binding protein 1-like n=1 Tax=Octopus sinensis TaxID=2607531 RepID=A0A7E6EGP5_9MOLL|nr:GTP-binding protein 1-like [Octopus sinensis]
MQNDPEIVESQKDQQKIEIIKNEIENLMQLSRGETFYVLGKEDFINHCRNNIDLDKLEKLFQQVVKDMQCQSISLCDRKSGDGPVRDFRIRNIVDEYDFIETRSFKNIIFRITVAGNVDTGKTTLLGVLTHNTSDDGRGSARSKMFNHKHEAATGRTSSIGVNIVGFDYAGNCLNNPDRGKLDWQKLCKKASKVVSLIDLAGHEKYLKTTISGMFGYAPDACMLIVISHCRHFRLGPTQV